MSKIYEALQRAELERASKNGPHSNGSQAAEKALANTLEAYHPETQPHFGELLSMPPSPFPTEAEPVILHAAHGSTAVAPLPTPFASPILASPILASPILAPPIAVPPATIPPAAMPATNPPAFYEQVWVDAPAPVPTAPFQPRTQFRPQSQPQPHPTDTHDPNGPRVLTWNPVMERLPALTERGRSVEQFRSLRSRLAEFRDSSVPLKSLLVTSGLPQEGKSFIAANLALSLSRHRANRVLLIDADIRRSSLHAMLGTTAEPGLTDFLNGRAQLPEVMQRCRAEDPEPAFHNGLSSLTFIPGGSEPDKAADLSGSPRFAELLEQLGPLFDWIIIDSSPVNLVSDGVNFARICDGVLLVAREGVTKFETAQSTQQQLKSARILGFVLNAVHTASAKTDEYNYGPYGTYGSYGGYGYSTTKR